MFLEAHRQCCKYICRHVNGVVQSKCVRAVADILNAINESVLFMVRRPRTICAEWSATTIKMMGGSVW